MICRMDFDMSFAILIFDPKSGFFMGYRLCIMADFQNGLFLEYLVLFRPVFLHKTTLNDL